MASTVAWRPSPEGCWLASGATVIVPIDHHVVTGGFRKRIPIGGVISRRGLWRSAPRPGHAAIPVRGGARCRHGHTIRRGRAATIGCGRNIHRAVIVCGCAIPVRQLRANHIAPGFYLVVKSENASRANERVQVPVGVHRADHVKIRTAEEREIAFREHSKLEHRNQRHLRAPRHTHFLPAVERRRGQHVDGYDLRP